MSAKAEQITRLRNALWAFLRDAKIRTWLDANDPKSVEQAVRALAQSDGGVTRFQEPELLALTRTGKEST